MKRRNGECGKLRRPIKRNKITDGIYGSTVLYLKFFILWALVLLADFILEFRFEFLWPFWLLLRSVYDSYKYQGLAFSIFFVSIALTSDMICYFFIPVQWLFFAASTYVWVQYVWHTEKGICLPTVILWLLFAYTEAAIRLKDLRHMPFHLDLCRPFAAHCIGYPVVTLGFGFKSYVTYRIRQRKQKDVRKENNFYMTLLSQALPIEAVQTSTQNGQTTSLDKSKADVQSNGLSHNGVSSKSSSHRKSLDKGDRAEPVANGSTPHHTHEIEFTLKPASSGDNEDEIIEKERKVRGHHKGTTSSTSTASDKRDNYKKSRQTRGPTCEPPQPHDPNPPPFKDDYCLKLEADVKRLRSELASSRQGEQELRSQVNSLIASEKQIRSEMSSLLHHNDELQTKVQNLGALRQGERQTAERKLAEERRARCVLEQQLSCERKAKQRAEEAASRANAAAAAAAASKPECTESCRSRRRELEAEMKQLRRELKLREERCANTDRELQTMLQYKESHNEAEMLMGALSALRDKTSHLEDSLSAETRIKLDLFSALGEAKRQLEIKDSLIRAHEKEVAELKGKMAQVLAVMPVEFVSAAGGVVGGGGGVSSPLDPNASVYTPKQQPSGHLTSEA